MFGWWFGFNEAYPRGQRSASMMVAEVGMGDAWYRAFEAPHRGQVRGARPSRTSTSPHSGSTRRGTTTASGALHVGTYAAAPDRRGLDTSWRVTNLPSTDDVFILCDGEPFRRFSVDGPNAIRLDTTIDPAPLPDLHRLSGTGRAGGRRAPAGSDRPARGGTGRDGGARDGEPAGAERGERHDQFLAERTGLSLLRGIDISCPGARRAPGARPPPNRACRFRVHTVEQEAYA